MHKYPLILWLVISILGYGSAWAFDGHFDAAVGHPTVSDGRTQIPNGDHPCYDHCGHAAAHTLGLPFSSSSPNYPAISMGYTPYQPFLSCYLIAPPERPPQS